MSLGSCTCSASKSLSICLPPIRAAWIEPLPSSYPRRLFPAIDRASCKSVFDRGACRTHGFRNSPISLRRQFVTNFSTKTPSNPVSNSLDHRLNSDTDGSEQVGAVNITKRDPLLETRTSENQGSPNEPHLSANPQSSSSDIHKTAEGGGDATRWRPKPKMQKCSDRKVPELPTWSSLGGQMDINMDALVWQTRHLHSSTQARFPVMPASYEPHMWRPENTDIGTSTSFRSVDSKPFTQRAKEKGAQLWGRKLANQILKDKGQLSSDWRVPLKLLLSSAKNLSVEQSDGEQVYLPEQVLVSLVGSANAGTWTMNLRSKCEIHVLPQSESSGVMRRVILSGTPLSVDVTKDHISLIWAEIASTRPSFFESVPFLPSITTLLNDQNDNKLRSVWTHLRLPQDRKQRMRANEIERPGEWTTKNFADYIEDITADYMPRGAHRHFYQGDERHVNIVEGILKELFTTSSNAQFFSTRALNRAIWFLYAHRFLPTARILCAQFDEAGGTFVAETFNIMLMAASRERDLFNYTYTLASMIRLGLKPDPRAWVALLYTIESQDVRLVVMRYMKRTGLLADDLVIKHAVAALVKESFGSHLDDDRDFADYVELMDNLYGRAWFGTVAGNKMLSALAARGRLDGVPEVLNLYHERDIRMDKATLHQVLILCRDLGAIPFAIDTFKEMRIKFQVHLDELCYWLLFDMAWEARLHNVCRTVWIYSCLSGLTPYRMQRMVLRSLRNLSDKDPWWHQAGKVIAGVAPTPQRFSMKQQLLNSIAAEAADTLSARSLDAPPAEPQPDHPRRTNDLCFQIAREILDDDLSAGFRWRPCNDLHSELCSAYERDDKWELERLGTDSEATQWMISNVGPAPVQMKSMSPLKNQGLKVSELVRLSPGGR